MDSAARRWGKLVKARMAEIERLQPGRADVGSGAFWDRRAKNLATGPMRRASAEKDPLFRRLRRAVTPATTVLDVGSGPGRFSLALAPRAKAVTAVDPSKRMLTMIRRQAKEEGLTNVATITGKWQEVEVEPADLVLCSHVLPLITDVAPFLAKLDAAARKRVFVYLGAFAGDAIADPLWRHFHGSSRRPGPSYLDAIDVLTELGITPHVEVVEIAVRPRHADLDVAVKNYVDALLLPNTAAIRKELAQLLDPWLQRSDGGLRPPFKSQPATILSWQPAPGGR